MTWTLDKLFDVVLDRSASDVALVPGAPPTLWVHGEMHRLDAPALTGDEVREVFFPLLDPRELEHLRREGDLDFSRGRERAGRFRINLHRQRGSFSAALRFVPDHPPAFDELKLPERVLELAELPRGLVLVTGRTGSGKSTTLAAMIQHINRTSARHIITLEDPIEYTFSHERSIIEQREIGLDCPSFVSALRHVVRQRPDAILVGEMRDLETISAALTAAETGCLVLASLHTVSATETVNRIVDAFPANQQEQVRVQLADTLQGVLCQMLFRDEIDATMVPAAEILLTNAAVRRAIRDNETHLLAGMIETGRGAGMQGMDAAIATLATEGRIAAGEALAKAHNPERLARTLV